MISSKAFFSRSSKYACLFKSALSSLIAISSCTKTAISRSAAERKDEGEDAPPEEAGRGTSSNSVWRLSNPTTVDWIEDRTSLSCPTYSLIRDIAGLDAISGPGALPLVSAVSGIPVVEPKLGGDADLKLRAGYTYVATLETPRIHSSTFIYR